MDRQLDNLFVATALIVMAAVYITPTVVAFYRRHPNRWVILLINVVFGTTILGWGVALVWAFHGVHRSRTKNHGGESGLNLFVNDPKKIELLNERSHAAAADEIGRLHQLLQSGAITQTEFDAFKARLLTKT